MAILEKTWIEYARTLPTQEVIDSYVDEIEDITNCIDQRNQLETSIKEIILIYGGLL